MTAERARIREIAESRIRHRMWRIHVLMRRKGWLINHKMTHRIYCDEGLHLHRWRPRHRMAAQRRESRLAVFRINKAWSMDFVADELFNGTDFGPVVDKCSGRRWRSGSISGWEAPMSSPRWC